MMKRRSVLKGLAGMTALGLVPRLASGAPAKVRVTLVRWPYT
jgi:hypothetical protein